MDRIPNRGVWADGLMEKIGNLPTLGDLSLKPRL